MKVRSHTYYMFLAAAAILFFFAAQNSYAQQPKRVIQLSGVTMDTATGPVPYVNIYVPAAGRGVNTSRAIIQTTAASRLALSSATKATRLSSMRRA